MKVNSHNSNELVTKIEQSRKISVVTFKQNCYRAVGWFMINYYRKDPPFLSLEVPPHTHLLGSPCPPPEERRLSMPETGEKERNYLF